MKNIILTGFMGTGKTEVGRILSKKMGRRLVDVDGMIEDEQKMTVSDIFREFGEQRFRDLEADAVRRLSEMSNLLISTGGGVVLREENLESLRKNGTVICLTASPETILKRVCSNSDRPLLQVDDPLARIKELVETRRKYYERSDMVIDTEDRTPLEVAEEIITRVSGD